MVIASTLTDCRAARIYIYIHNIYRCTPSALRSGPIPSLVLILLVTQRRAVQLLLLFFISTEYETQNALEFVCVECVRARAIYTRVRGSVSSSYVVVRPPWR